MAPFTIFAFPRLAPGRTGLLFCFGLLFPLFTWAQHSYLHFSHLSTENGLSNNNLRAICQDRTGFLWFGTGSGLDRYDGKHFVVYRHSFYDKRSISSDAVSAIAVDSTDNIWVTTTNSVSCLDRRTGRFTNYYYRDNQGNITTNTNLFKSIAIMPSGKPLAYSRLVGLLQIDKQHQNLVPAHFPLIPWDADPRRLFLTANGWIGFRDEQTFLLSGDGGVHFQKVLERESVPRGIPFSSLSLIAADSLHCWLAVTGIPYYRATNCFMVDLSTKRIHAFTVRPANLTAITSYPDHSYWMGFWGDGLMTYNEAKGEITEHYSHSDQDPTTPSNDEVQDVYRDKDNNIWIATDEGIDYCNPMKANIMVLHNDMEGFGHMRISNIESMALDDLGRIWMGMEVLGGNGAGNGLLCYDPKTFQASRFLEKKGYGDAALIWEILPEEGQNLLLSTQLGLYQFNTRTQILNRSFHQRFPAEVRDTKDGLPILSKDREGNYWFGIWMRGLIKFNPRSHRSVYYTADAVDPRRRLNDDFVTALTEDDHQRMWVVNARNNIIDCIDSGYIRHFPVVVNGQAFSDELLNIQADRDGRLWIGSQGGGLIRYDPSGHQARLFTSQDGLPSETINALCVDAGNKLWVYTALGLVWIDSSREAIHALDDDIPLFKSYFDEEPMVAAKDGHIYAGNGQTVFFFSPDKMVARQQVKPPVFTAIHKMSKTYPVGPAVTRVKVSPGEDFLRFDFISLDMTRNRQINYAYRLMGYNGQWQSAGNEGVAVFTKLPPGNYQLQIRSALQGVQWDGRVAFMDIEVTPAFYQTTWFRILLLLTVCCSLGYLIYYLSTNKLNRRLAILEGQQQIADVRNRIAQDIHDEIGSGLTKISIQSELAKQQKGISSSEYLKIMTEINLQSHELVNNLGEIVWTINPQYDKLESVLAYFRHYISQFFEGLGVRYQIDFPELLSNMIIHPDIKRNLFLVLKESLNNIIKHASATEVRVSLEIHAVRYKLCIADNGIGIPEKPGNEFGNGLTGMRKRAGLIHASLEINSSLDAGTVVQLKGDFYGPE